MPGSSPRSTFATASSSGSIPSPVTAEMARIGGFFLRRAKLFLSAASFSCASGTSILVTAMTWGFLASSGE